MLYPTEVQKASYSLKRYQIGSIKIPIVLEERQLELSESPAILSTDTIFTWYSETVKTDCWCRLRIYKITLDHLVVIVSELPDNPGRSITDEASKLINLVCYQFGLAPYKVMWIEHYPVGYLKDDETYDELRQGLGKVSSKRINKQKLEVLLGVQL